MEKLTKTQALQLIHDMNKKAVKVIDSCQNMDHIKSARKYINLVESRNINFIENLLGVKYFSYSSKIRNNHSLISNVVNQFQKTQIFLKVKEQQIRSYERD
jgi:hypothetical protein